MTDIVLIGTGNVARHLFQAFEPQPDLDVIQVYGRSAKGLDFFKDKTETTSELEALLPATVYIICISDDAIDKISQALPFRDRLVVHTSGSIPISALAPHQRRGIFYPLQTFSKGVKTDFKQVPLFLEATEQQDLNLLKSIGRAISDTVFEADSDQRKQLHLAAVFVNNFPNYMFQIAKELLEEKNLPFEVLKPLIKETANKLESMSPNDAQTGPARRGDKKTLETHEKMLKDPKYSEIYRLLSQSIQKHYGIEL
ncbi:Rossmann-like and DUF2520 domain-containing protein [Poritiphilus flavus]|uniref:DUF2520 domain-containing protein n=1 Tax=Poritiphilus flavus TaxID=2697053 RepID=A0A6L9EDY9_9FLAO|nr:DUF2520 domain-containing protein [Poritiphilus flavus]NAS12974.1 DUF2520 domain-containing protein [Poritiphilus flavus]